MEEDQTKTVFRTAEEFMEYLADLRPMLEAMREGSRQDHSAKGRKMFQEAEKLLKTLDPEFLRSRFKPNRPDGSMEICFTEDATSMLRAFRR